MRLFVVEVGLEGLDGPRGFDVVAVDKDSLGTAYAPSASAPNRNRQLWTR